MKRYLVVAVAALLLIGLPIWWFQGEGPVDSDQLTPEELYGFNPAQCPGPTTVMKMSDVYLRGLLEMGEAYRAQMNWYACNPIEKGDLVLYRFSHHHMPVVRRVVAVAGDEIEVTFEKQGGFWTLAVNGEMVLSVDEKPYFFGGEAEPPLALYAKEKGNKVAEGDVVVFSSFPPGSEDSGNFGAVGLGDLVAKVERMETAP